MFNEFYGLTLDPFRLSPDPRFCYRHRNFAKAKAYMQYALHQREGFVMVTGQPGTGKTTLIEDLLADTTTTNVRVARMMSTQVAADDLLRLVASAFGIDTTNLTKASILLGLQRVLIRQMQSGHNSLLIVDEAQNLPHDSLEELRMITNLQLASRPLLQVFLVGQDGLLALVGQPSMEQLRQRILAACSMEPLGVDDTRDYLQHRLRCAAWKGKPSLSGEAVWQLHHATGGVPRRINLLASRLLLHGFIEGRLTLDAADVRLVTDELQGEFLMSDRATPGASSALPTGVDPTPDFASLAIKLPPLAEVAEPAPPTAPPRVDPPTESSAPPQQVQPGQAFSSDTGRTESADHVIAKPTGQALPVGGPPDNRPTHDSSTQADPAAHRSVQIEGTAGRPSPVLIAPARIPAAEPSPAPASQRQRGTTPAQPAPARTRRRRRSRGLWFAAAVLLVSAALVAAFLLRPDWLGKAVERLRPTLEQLASMNAHQDRAPEGVPKVVATPPQRPAPELSPPLPQPEMTGMGLVTPAARVPSPALQRTAARPEPTVEQPEPTRVEPLPAESEPISIETRTQASHDQLALQDRPDGQRDNWSGGSQPEGPDPGPSAIADNSPLATAAAILDAMPLPESSAGDRLQSAPTTSPAATQEAPRQEILPIAAPEPVFYATPAVTPPPPTQPETRAAAPQQGDEDGLASLASKLADLGLQPERTADGEIRLNLGREFQFDAGSAEVTPQAQEAIQPLVQLLASRPPDQITVIGHTDDSGPAALNADLSLRRASVFAQTLTEGGVPAQRITSEGRGETEPLTWRAIDGIPAHLINRRIEILIRSADRPTEARAD